MVLLQIFAGLSLLGAINKSIAFRSTVSRPLILPGLKLSRKFGLHEEIVSNSSAKVDTVKQSLLERAQQLRLEAEQLEVD